MTRRIFRLDNLGLVLDIALGATLLSCTTARMVVPVELAAAPSWAVEGSNPRLWSRPLAFGPYRTAAVSEPGEGWVTLGDSDFGAGFAWRPYWLTLTGPGGEARMACHAFRIEAAAGGVTADLTGTVLPALRCRLRDGLGADLGELRVSVRRGQELVGRLSAPGLDAEIASVHRLEGSPLRVQDPAGYRISRGGRTMAAVETLNRGRVWIDGSVPDGSALAIAGASAALLLLKPDMAADLVPD